jgi:NAD+ synthase (glutamine-hydrolysing)
MEKIKVVLAQTNQTVGDVRGNLNKMFSVVERNSDADFIIFPELFLSGYPPMDLLDIQGFVKEVEGAIYDIISFSCRYPKLAILFGAPLPTKKSVGKRLYNSALVVSNGEIVFRYNKVLLPTYDVFDEARYFESDTSSSNLTPFYYKGIRFGITICEDAWTTSHFFGRELYDIDPICELYKKGVDVFINISSSPFHIGKEKIRYNIIKSHIDKYRKPFIYLNQVGGNDELVFDGRSFMLSGSGKPIFVLSGFREEVYSFFLDDSLQELDSFPFMDEMESLLLALITGLRDYLRKTGFKKVVIGLSGGIDSSLVAAISVMALGKENVIGVAMPSIYSSSDSVRLAKKLAENLGIDFYIVDITDIYMSYINSLSSIFGYKGDIMKDVELFMENIQARIRGNILMSFSNRFGYLVISTGNKSELSVGYTTLYGDMAGGLALISDLPKTMVYKLSRYINREREIIPYEIIERVPSAELRPNQKDQDTLPPYEVLDKILELYIEEMKTYDEIVSLGYDEELVKWVLKAVSRNEYKRRQAPIGIKVTTKAFGIGRRMPIAAKY